MEGLVEQNEERADRPSRLRTLAEARARAGDFEKAKALVIQIQDPREQHHAILRVAKALSDQARFEDAVVYAENIPRSSGTLFVTMEGLALDAAKGGDVKSAFRASRGMNPGQGGSMARKLIAVGKMCNSFCKTGNKKSAIPFMGQGKKFSDISRLDLESTLIVDTTWAAIQAEDFEAELKTLLARADKADPKVDKKYRILLEMARVTLSFDHVDLMKHFRSAADDKTYRLVLDWYEAYHLADTGNALAIKAIEKIEDSSIKMHAWVKLADFYIKAKQPEVGIEYLDRAALVLRKYREEDETGKSAISMLSDLISAKSAVGQHVEALALVKQCPNTVKIPELLIEVVKSMK